MFILLFAECLLFMCDVSRLPIGMGLLTICVGLVSLFDQYTPFSEIYGFTVIGGAGLGCMFSSAIIALQASAEPRDIAVVTGLGNFSRILGGALGVAISSAILNSSLSQDLPQFAPPEVVKSVLESSEYVRHGCPPEYFEQVLESYQEALKLIWHVMTAFSGVGFFCSLLVKSAPILKPKTPSGDVTDAHDIHEGVVVAVEMPPSSKNYIQPHEGAADINHRNQ